ncbi:MAG: hypothetical protein IOC54_17110 [Methylobacterium sp.]|nr:hypothetical protein [Methylobacterium sp.]
MRDPRNALKPFLVKETQAAREKLAARHFALDAITQRVTEAAMRGEGAIRLCLGEQSAELRTTKAATELLAWCERNGLRAEWIEITIPRPNGLRLRTAELVLSWVDETLAS